MNSQHNLTRGGLPFRQSLSGKFPPNLAMSATQRPVAPPVYRPILASSVQRKPAIAAPTPMAFRPSAVRTSFTIQSRQTFTGLKTEHATAVYKNYFKGDPPFKPQKGNFGKVSWFAGSGNPYVGGQTQSYTVKVDVTVPDQITLLTKDFFTQFMTKYIKETGVDLENPLTHGEFWKAFGRALEKENLVEVTVPQCVVSRQGGGTFIAANANARLAVALTNPAKLRQDLVTLGVQVTTIEQAVDARNATNSPAFTIVFPSVMKNVMTQAADDKVRFLNDLRRKVIVPGCLPPTSVTWTKAAVPAPSNPILAKAYIGRQIVTITLTYADYKVARQQAKYWATISSNQTIVNDYGRLTITGGANWSDKATRAYTSQY